MCTCRGSLIFNSLKHICQSLHHTKVTPFYSYVQVFKVIFKQDFHPYATYTLKEAYTGKQAEVPFPKLLTSPSCPGCTEMLTPILPSSTNTTVFLYLRPSKKQIDMIFHWQGSRITQKLSFSTFAPSPLISGAVLWLLWMSKY